LRWIKPEPASQEPSRDESHGDDTPAEEAQQSKRGKGGGSVM
jgi:hypothetical protein